MFHDLEREFWKNVATRTPLYGADSPGSLFHPDASWNMGKFETMLDIIDKDKLPGVTSPYLYFGSYGALFGWHTEDIDLPSINYLHFGRPKLWYGVPHSDSATFEDLAFKAVPHESCRQFTRHKEHMFHPKILESKGVKVYRAIQKANEFIITFPKAFHAGWNLGFNCAEAVNFAFPEWVPYGMKSESCSCGTLTMPVTMNVPSLLLDVKEKWPEQFSKIPGGEKLLKEHMDEAIEGRTQKEKVEEKESSLPTRMGRMAGRMAGRMTGRMTARQFTTPDRGVKRKSSSSRNGKKRKHS